jgi:glycosyltransferase involved in cell wall biosynthesis
MKALSEPGQGQAEAAPGRVIRLAHFVTHPIQYFAPLYRALASLPGIDLTVFFGSRHGLEASFDEGFGRAVRFDVPLLDGYRHRFLVNRGSGVSSRGYANFDCPEADDLFRPANFDLVWLHGWAYRAHRQIIQAARRSGLPYLIRAETNLVIKPRYSLRWLASRLLVGGMLRAAAGCLCVGRSNRDFYRSLGVPESRLHPAHYSVDGHRFRDAAGSPEDRGRVRAEHGAGPATFVVAASAKAIPRKRLQDAVRAVGRLGADAHLWVLGDGPLRARLEGLACREAPGRVRWHGFVNQSRIPALLGAADVFVMPSEDEPWGLAVNEAMACGLPAVCSDGVGCAADLVRPGETGYLHRVGDVRALANHLDDLRADRAACRRMGQAAQELVLRDYDVKTTATQIAAAARAVLSTHRGNAAVGGRGC